MLELPERLGFGIELDESKIADVRAVSWQQSYYKEPLLKRLKEE